MIFTSRVKEIHSSKKHDLALLCLDEEDRDLERERNIAIKKITDELSGALKLNTIVSTLMILMNKIDKYKVEEGNHLKQALLNCATKDLVKLLAPLTPHVAEEMWQMMGQKDASISFAGWPTVDENALKQNIVQVVVQVNGKLRGKFDLSPDSTEEQIKALALADPKILEFMGGKPIKKVIYVPGKLVNFVV